MTLLMGLAAGLLVCFWLALGALHLAGSRQVRSLVDVLAEEEGARGLRLADVQVPPLSIIVTARDEAAAIENTVRLALAQRYPNLEVIVVDDRSTDGTGAILDRLAEPGDGDPRRETARRGDARLTVMHVRDLPAGWIGKCHACDVGARRATGEWLLFMDGDVRLAAGDLLQRVVALAEARRIDHLSVFPDLRPLGPLQGSLMLVFEQAFLFTARAWEIDRDRPRGGAGVGAFNLLRREAYLHVGGHTLLKMDVVDDLKLGRLLKESGARQRLYSGVDLVFCPWQRGAGAVVRGLEKNLFAGLDYSIGAVVAQTGIGLIAFLGPLVVGMACGGALGPALRWAPLLVQAVVLVSQAGLSARRLSTHPLGLLAFYPAALGLLFYAAWNSMLATLWRGGVLWRGTFYPLADLRRARVRPGAGRRFGPAGRETAARHLSGN
jgi:cellulose synthase/poly-beta-1,6-N-acetylglucosamine synthase-like glycosyltransferase